MSALGTLWTFFPSSLSIPSEALLSEGFSPSITVSEGSKKAPVSSCAGSQSAVRRGCPCRPVCPVQLYVLAPFSPGWCWSGLRASAFWWKSSRRRCCRSPASVCTQEFKGCLDDGPVWRAGGRWSGDLCWCPWEAFQHEEHRRMRQSSIRPHRRVWPCWCESMSSP